MVGIDLVFLPEFKRKLKNISLEKVFSETELSQNKASESLAGIFAAKEAFFKAIGKKENWLEVWIEKDKYGKPQIQSAIVGKDKKLEVSISHGGDYAVAVVIIVEK